MLNLDKSKMRFGAFDNTYNEYYGIEKDVINNKTPFLTFNNIINEIVPIKNKDLLEKMQESYKKLGEDGFINKRMKLLQSILKKNNQDYHHKYQKYKTKYLNNKN
jgi:hypothetical protein